MIKKLILLSILPLALAGCGNKDEVEEEDVRAICPTGAPALAFYNQGSNPNFVTSSTPATVAAQLQKIEYDVVVFDSVNGLKSIKANKGEYQLAKVITGGNFYLVGIGENHKELPKVGDKVVSFGQNLIPDLVYSKLCQDHWKIYNSASYVNGVQDALAVLKEGKYSGGDVDYVFIAEPALTSALSDKEAKTYGKINIVKNIREEWKAFSGQDGLAQAGVFVKKSSLETKKNKLSSYLKEIEEHIDIAINNPAEAKATMDLFGSLQEQVTRFGFNSNIVSKVQENNRNGFGLVSKTETIDVNAFLTKLGQDTYSDDYFVNV